MNIKQIFLPLFGVLALIGCKKEAVEPTSSNTTQANSVTLALSLEGTADASEMRAVSFDANQNVPPTTHDQYSDWTTHCFLRNADGSKKAYAVINWDATLEGGKVKLKMRGHELNLLPIGSASAELAPENNPVAGERWSIVGITGGGKLNDDRTRVDFAPDADLDNNLQPHQARVPFTFEKAYFTVSAASGERAPQISVHFKPQGSLLNVHVNNATNRGKHAVATDLKLYTNALSNNGYYDYSTGEAQWKFTNESAQEEVISRPITVDKDADAKYVLWGMPRPETAKPSEGFKSEIYLGRYKIFAEGSTTAKPKVRQVGFTNGLAYPMGINIDRPFMPLEYVAKYNVAEDRASFATTHHTKGDQPTNDNEYMEYTQAEQLFKHIAIEDKTYHLPNIWEAYGLGSFPDLPGFAKQLHDPSVTIRNDQLSFEMEGKRYDGYSEESNVVEVNTQYSLRFFKSNNKDMMMAYRYVYEVTPDVSPDFSHASVTSRYLGAQDISLADISREDFWNTNNSDDCTVRFPLVGFMYTRNYIPNDTKQSDRHGTHSNVWLCESKAFQTMGRNDAPDPMPQSPHPGKIRRFFVSLNLPTTVTYYFPVRLFSDRVY